MRTCASEPFPSPRVFRHHLRYNWLVLAVTADFPSVELIA